MKKTINYRLTMAEKQLLKTKRISQKLLQDYAPDEIAALLNASPHRARELNALAEFQSIPSLGINFAEEQISQGYYTLEQLKGRSAVELFDAFEQHCGTWVDPCVEDSYRLLAHYIENRDDSKRWWHFTAERKAYREQHGFPANRPQQPWHQSVKYSKLNKYQRGLIMEQLSFFSEAGQSKGLPKELLEYHPGFIDEQTSNYLLQKFIAEIPWKQTRQKMWDKEYLTPRLTSWHGDIGTDYSVSGKVSNPNPWTPELLLLKEKVEAVADIKFNSVLLNYYRDGNDSVSWHSDREAVLGKNPIIASVSFGQVRGFDIRNKSDHKKHYSVKLEHGSFLLMKAGLQEHWEHRIAKSVKPMKARVNLTFRVVI